jgi:hypothetical protein
MEDAMELTSLTADGLQIFIGLLLSLLMYLIPPFKVWLKSLGDWAPMFMAGFLFFVATIWQFALCQWVLICLWQAMPGVVVIWFAAFGANQGTYLAYVKPDKKQKLLTAEHLNSDSITNRFST